MPKYLACLAITYFGLMRRIQCGWALVFRSNLRKEDSLLLTVPIKIKSQTLVGRRNIAAEDVGLPLDSCAESLVVGIPTDGRTAGHGGTLEPHIGTGHGITAPQLARNRKTAIHKVLHIRVL